MEPIIPFSVIILAGGFGKRLGRDKATTEAGGRPLLHWSALAASAVSDDIVVARRPDQDFPPLDGVVWREAIDHRHDRGPLAGLEAALPLIRHDLAVAVACDMPFLQPELLRAVAEACADTDIAMPYLDGVAQPLLAAYRPVRRAACDTTPQRRQRTPPRAPAAGRASLAGSRRAPRSRSRTEIVHQREQAGRPRTGRTSAQTANNDQTGLTNNAQNRTESNKTEQDRTAFSS